ncbi:hypothetical protein BVRB_1g000530 [Beta vulgaris subsp. vulgaris]|nr:hypothetical protein BVRB_1g000530 [Beta vulgaris subsp. vulgaris]
MFPTDANGVAKENFPPPFNIIPLKVGARILLASSGGATITLLGSNEPT